MKLRFSQQSLRRSQRSCAFTLLEVIIACGIFFLVAFAVLEVVTTGLAAARKLQLRHPDAGILAAEMTLTNRLEEGITSGDFDDQYPGLYDGYSWEREILEAWSNRLFQVDFSVYNNKARGPSDTHMRILLYSPNSPAGSASKAR